MADDRCSLEGQQRAEHHPIVAHRPAVNFFQWALLGTGGLGTKPGDMLHMEPG